MRNDDETPICTALFAHVAKARGPLHVPGHQQGRTLPDTLELWLGHAAKLDLTELPGLDNLAQPQGCILESQQLTAKFYGSDQCFYSVNGSSAGIMAALLATSGPASTVLFLNPFHISAWHGLVHSGAKVRRLPWVPSTGTHVPPNWIDPKQLAKELDERTDISAVYLTSPTYRGDCANVAAVADLVHRRGLPLIVDEAHGAHFGLTQGLPTGSIQAGADVVVQSVHKMLPGLTQTAWVHLQGERVDARRLQQSLRSLQSTSPSYLLLASLDSVQYWLRSEGAEAAEQTLTELQRNGLLQTREKSGKVLRDPLKHWVPVQNPIHARNLAERLMNRGLYPEYVDTTGVLSILGLKILPRVLQEYASVVKEWREWSGSALKAGNSDDNFNDDGTDGVLFQWNLGEEASQFELSPREAQAAQTRLVPLQSAAGLILGAPLLPYPPGVPVLYPGQVLTDAWICQLKQWLAAGREVHGIDQRERVAVIV